MSKNHLAKPLCLCKQIMGNVMWWKKTSGDPDSEWKQQNNEQAQNPMYKYADLQRNGKLIDTYVDMGQEALEKLIKEELEPMLYNKGEGKLVTKAELVRLRNEKIAKLRGETTVLDTRSDEEVLKDYVEDPFIKLEDHWAVWDLRKRGGVGETCLHMCVLHDTPIHLPIARTLLRMYPKLALDYYEGDEYFGEGCLHFSIVYGDFDSVRLLVESGANVTLRATGRFFLPEDQKTKKKKKETNYDGYAYYGEYPLAFAACFGHEEIYDYLIDHGANPRSQDSFGNTVLHMLVICNQIGMFAYAVNHHVEKADMEIPNYQGMTPLTLASKLGRNEIFKEIIELQRVEIWRYSNITCATYPIAPLDTIGEEGKTNWSSALMYITAGETSEHLEMLEGGVIRQLLDEKWKTFARRRFYERLIITFMHLLTLTIAIVLRPEKDLLGPTDSRSIIRYIAEIIVCLGCVVQLVSQIEEIRSQGIFTFLRNQTSAPAKCVFNISCLLILLCIPMRLIGEEGIEQVLLAGACPSAWFFLLFFARGFELSGPFVTIFYKMVTGDLYRFGLIYIIFLLGYIPGFYFLFKDIEDKSIHSFQTAQETFMQLFQMTLGEFKYEDFSQTRIPILTKGVFFVFAMLVPILLLNMLIAMMGNTYNMIISRSEKEWKLQWAKIIIVLERTFSRKDLLRFQEEYSVKMIGSKKEAERGLMVIKTSNKTKARQRKGAISNWKRLVNEVKSVIKDYKKGGKSGNFDLSASITDRQMRKKNNSMKAKTVKIDEDSEDEAGGLLDAMAQLAWEKDIDLTKGKVFSKVESIKAEENQKHGSSGKPPNPKKQGNSNNSNNNKPSGGLVNHGANFDNKKKSNKTDVKKPEHIGLKEVKACTPRSTPKLGGKKVYPEESSVDSAIAVDSSGPKTKGQRNGSGASNDSKDSAFSDDKKKKKVKGQSQGSKSSMNSASSLTSLLHAWDDKVIKD